MTEGQDQEARPRGIDQLQQSLQSRQAKTAQVLDHMVQGTQELPVNHSWSVHSSPHICDQGVCGSHRVATQLRIRTVFRSFRSVERPELQYICHESTSANTWLCKGLDCRDLDQSQIEEARRPTVLSRLTGSLWGRR